jgi:hypothetical protein
MTEAQICNLALSRLGSSLFITALTDTTVQGIQCNLVYANARDMVLEGFPWNFATRTELLTEQTEETHPLYSFVYAYPSSCLRVLRVFPAGAAKTTREVFEVYNTVITATQYKRIASDIEDAYAEYILAVTDPTLFSLGFVDAMAWKLAAMLCVSVKGSAKDLPMLEAEYTQARSRAQANDANEGVRTPARSTKYKESRG